MVVHAHEFLGKPIENYEPDRPLANPRSAAIRVALSPDECDDEVSILEKLASLFDDPKVEEITALIIGVWSNYTEGSEPIVESIVSARERLPNLRGLFLGDIISEELEMSWIAQSDVSSLFTAFPRLEVFRVRGNEGLVFHAMDHENLRTLIVESGGLNRDVVRDICRSNLPRLEHLELWLGVARYGGTVTLDDLQPILSGELFAELRYLGLRDSEMADALAPVVASSPIVRRIEELDLSLGTMGDEGGKALLSLPTEGKLKRLTLCHHFISDEVIEQLTERLPFEIDASDRQEVDNYDGEEHRYVAVSE